jgi:hypothetical protein
LSLHPSFLLCGLVTNNQLDYTVVFYRRRI